MTIIGWPALGCIGLGSGIGYYLWLWALRHITAVHVTVFLAFNPITATGLSFMLFGEHISLAFVIRLVCVASGIWLIQVER